jgi:hypothetical protein
MLAFLRICSGPTLLSATIHLRIIVRLGDGTFNFNIQRMVALSILTCSMFVILQAWVSFGVFLKA